MSSWFMDIGPLLLPPAPYHTYDQDYLRSRYFGSGEIENAVKECWQHLEVIKQTDGAQKLTILIDYAQAD